MLERFRGFWQGVVSPPARLFLAWGVSPDLITTIGTLGVCLGALICFPHGWLWQGVVVITAFVLSDMIDGQMARLSGQASEFGAFLDSTLDRLGDAAVFGGLLLYFAGPGDDRVGLVLCLVTLVMSMMTSYTRARAESVGLNSSSGVAQRADRLLIVLAGALLADLLDRPVVLTAMLGVLAIATTVTVGQRIWAVRQQAHPRARDAG